MGGNMIFTNQTPATNLDWLYVWGEVKELWQEICRFNLKGIRNELCDVYTCAMCAIETSTGIPMPIFWMRSANAWEERMSFFKWYLEEVGLEFKVEYLRFGANYNKAHKRRKVFDLAVEDQILMKLCYNSTRSALEGPRCFEHTNGTGRSGSNDRPMLMDVGGRRHASR